MTPAEVTAARLALGFNTAAALGRALELEGRDPGRTVKQWESGKAPIMGPARVALRLMLEKAQAAPQAANEAVQAVTQAIAASGITEPPGAPPESVLAPMLKTRRRA